MKIWTKEIKPILAFYMKGLPSFATIQLIKSNVIKATDNKFYVIVYAGADRDEIKIVR